MRNEKPNIILITTDQQRHDTVGESSPDFLRTPHYDRLCHEGIVFSSAYSDCPLCVPARMSIMSGKYAFNHGMLHNGDSSQVLGRSDTLPALLGNLGYQTAAIGKMHFGPQRVRHGFDEMIIPEDYYREMTNAPSSANPMRHGLGQNELYPAMSTVPESKTLTSWITNKCVEYILERRDPTVPFFLWCSYSKPHPPFDPPEPYYSMYRNCAIPEPFYGDWSEDGKVPHAFKRTRETLLYDLIPTEVIREARSAYYGLVTHVDYSMGRLFAALQDVDLLDDSLLIYTSDHGEYLGDHHSGAKGYFHEPSAHVPFCLRLPKAWANRRNGTVVSSPVTHADILPTLVAAAGGAIPEVTDGQDLIAIARNELPHPREFLEGTVGFVTDWNNALNGIDYVAITDGNWKYIWYPEGGTEQLFNLREDPHELNNIADVIEYTDRKEELKQELVRRHLSRGSNLIQEGKLISMQVGSDSTKERRNNSWPGYHTEYLRVDVRH